MRLDRGVCNNKNIWNLNISMHKDVGKKLANILQTWVFNRAFSQIVHADACVAKQIQGLQVKKKYD